jgi:predicted SPOUT superfamily RNA methylase MTH1
MPIRVSRDSIAESEDDSDDQTITNVGLGGLAFLSSRPLEVQQRVTVSIPVLEQENELTGNVVWCEKADQGYEIGIEFERSRDNYRLRMIEQICHIEHYRREVERLEGRKLSSQQAAQEWIAAYAEDFPEL